MALKICVECVDSDDLHEIWASCTEMAQQMEYPSFFCSGSWLQASAENLLPQDKLIILLVKRNDIIKAILPLVSKRNGLGGRDLYFLGKDFYPDPVGLICVPSERATCAKALKDYLFSVVGWDRLFLDWVLENEMADWALPGMRVSTEPFRVLPQNITSLLGGFNNKKRYNLKTMVRKVQDAGGVLITSADTASHAAFLEVLFTLHQKRATEKSIESSFMVSNVNSFHRKLVVMSECVRFYGLYLEHHLIAVVYGFEFCGHFFFYQISHDPDYGKMSPGTVLLYLVIEDSCKKGLKEFNFLQGDESYKGIWTCESRDLYRCILKHNTWRSIILNGFDQGKAILKRSLERMWSGA